MTELGLVFQLSFTKSSTLYSIINYLHVRLDLVVITIASLVPSLSRFKSQLPLLRNVLNQFGGFYVFRSERYTFSSSVGLVLLTAEVIISMPLSAGDHFLDSYLNLILLDALC